LDVNASSGSKMSPEERRKKVNDEVIRIMKIGASKQKEWEEQGEYWVVLLDPEGNEFCVQ
jgi:hypothetical protein